MKVEEVFMLINNLDYREALRKHAPQWSTIAVNKEGIVVGVIQHKKEPTLALNKEHLLLYPGTVQFTAWPGSYKTLDELIKKIEECKEAHKKY
jgi:hypothetical protein